MTDQVLLAHAGFVHQVVPVSTEEVNLGEQLYMLTSRQTVPWSQFNSLASNGTFVDSR